MFDTIGTVIGVADKANLLDKDGKLPRVGRVLMADAVGTVAGSMFGTSTITSFVESSSGVAEGGKTGLTAMTTGLCSSWLCSCLRFSWQSQALPLRLR